MYQNSVLYKGNIVMNKDGTTLVLREGVVLGYDSSRDCFYDVEKVLPYSLSLDFFASANFLSISSISLLSSAP